MRRRGGIYSNSNTMQAREEYGIVRDKEESGKMREATDEDRNTGCCWCW